MFFCRPRSADSFPESSRECNQKNIFSIPIETPDRNPRKGAGTFSNTHLQTTINTLRPRIRVDLRIPLVSPYSTARPVEYIRRHASTLPFPENSSASAPLHDTSGTSHIPSHSRDTAYIPPPRQALSYNRGSLFCFAYSLYISLPAAASLQLPNEFDYRHYFFFAAITFFFPFIFETFGTIAYSFAPSATHFGQRWCSPAI